MRKLVRNLEKNRAYESDEDKDPYASSVSNWSTHYRQSTNILPFGFRTLRKKSSKLTRATTKRTKMDLTRNRRTRINNLKKHRNPHRHSRRNPSQRNQVWRRGQRKKKACRDQLDAQAHHRSNENPRQPHLPAARSHLLAAAAAARRS